MLVDNSLVKKYSLDSHIEEFKFLRTVYTAANYRYPDLQFKYPQEHRLRHNVFGSVFAWLLAPNHSRERKLLWWDLFSLIMLLPLTAMATSLGVKVLSQEMPPSMTGFVLAYTRFLQLFMMSATITLDAGVLSWTLIRLQYHILHWHKWYQRNCKVILLGFPESHQMVNTVGHVSSSSVREMQF